MRAKPYQTLFFGATGLIKTESTIEKDDVKGQPTMVLQIVSFLCTQWRPMNGTYDLKDFEVFDTFVKSFKFLKPDPFEEIIEQIKKLEG